MNNRYTTTTNKLLNNLKTVSPLTVSEKRQFGMQNQFSLIKKINECSKIGDVAFHHFITSQENLSLMNMLNQEGLIEIVYSVIYLYSSLDLTNNKFLSHTANSWIELAGDFYGLPNEPVSVSITEKNGRLFFNKRTMQEAMRIFNNAYNTLANFSDPSEEMKKNELKQNQISHIIVLENKILDLVQSHEISLQLAFMNYLNSNDYKEFGYSLSTVLKILEYFPVLSLSEAYQKLLPFNFDNFGKYAEFAYEAGHKIATETALAAHKAGDEKLKLRLLTKAFTQELFACHYLLKLFSPGLIRTPRLELVEKIQATHPYFSSAKNNLAAALCSQVMFHEDEWLGLEVSSQKHPEPWLLLGKYHNGRVVKSHKQSEQYKIEVVQTALQAIANIYRLGKDDQYHFKEYLPTVTQANPSPLFYIDQMHNELLFLDRNNPEKNVPSYKSDWATLLLFTPHQENDSVYSYPQLTAKSELSFDMDSKESNQIVDELGNYLKF